MSKLIKAPEFQVEKWLNTDFDISLDSLQGKVVMICVFQMLCPGCVQLGLPQSQKVHEAFSQSGVVVLGLHSVFEHHEAMKEESLSAFLYEYRLSFPVGIDIRLNSDTIPQTMKSYVLQGTPTTLLIDRQGWLRKKQFGHIPDLLLGAELMSLINEKDDKIQKLNDSEMFDDGKICNTSGACT